MARRVVELHFAGNPGVQLVETRVSDLSLNIERHCIRGKSSGAVRGAGSFQWTSAVKALSILFLKAALAKGDAQACEDGMLSGYQGSLAASLDFAISKQPLWLTEMFGVDSRGNSHVRRFVLRSNPERKRPGPVVLSFNPNSLETTDFRFFWDGDLVVAEEKLSDLLGLLEGRLGSGDLSVTIASIAA